MNKKQFKKHVGAKIQQLRIAAGITPEELGKVIGLHRVSMLNIENGNNATSLYRLSLLCSFLKCDITDLLPFMPPSKFTIEDTITPKYKLPKRVVKPIK